MKGKLLLLLFTNRNLHVGWLLLKSIDLKWPWTAQWPLYCTWLFHRILQENRAFLFRLSGWVRSFSTMTFDLDLHFG